MKIEKKEKKRSKMVEVTTEFGVLSLVVDYQSVPATYGEAIAGKRNLHKVLCHIGTLWFCSVSGYPVPFLSLLFTESSIQLTIPTISKCRTNGIN